MVFMRFLYISGPSNNFQFSRLSMEIVELSTRLEGTDTDHYNKAADYWQSVTPTINGMLGEITVLQDKGSVCRLSYKVRSEIEEKKPRET